MQYAHRFVQNADTAILSHREILTSRILRLPADSRGGAEYLSTTRIENVMANQQRPRTMAEKVWAEHVVASGDGEPDLI